MDERRWMKGCGCKKVGGEEVDGKEVDERM